MFVYFSSKICSIFDNLRKEKLQKGEKIILIVLKTSRIFFSGKLIVDRKKRFEPCAEENWKCLEFEKHVRLNDTLQNFINFLFL